MPQNQVVQLERILAHFSNGSLYAAGVDGADFTLKARSGGEWTANISRTLSVLLSLRREPGFAESDVGTRDLIRHLQEHVVPMLGPAV